MHQDKATVDFLERFALAPPVSYGGVPDALVKQRAERTRTLEADFETNVGNADAAHPQQLFGLLDSSLD